MGTVVEARGNVRRDEGGSWVLRVNSGRKGRTKKEGGERGAWDWGFKCGGRFR